MYKFRMIKGAAEQSL